jgi:simple sugar transport system ATP-binding protein
MPVGGLSVADNMRLRTFDRAPLRRLGGWLDRGAARTRAVDLITQFNVRPGRREQPIRSLSGGNVQRAVLARELAAGGVLLVSNPVFGLDFASVADIHARLLAARRAGAPCCWISEDLDELLELADRIA